MSQLSLPNIFPPLYTIWANTQINQPTQFILAILPHSIFTLFMRYCLHLGQSLVNQHISILQFYHAVSLPCLWDTVYLLQTVISIHARVHLSQSDHLVNSRSSGSPLFWLNWTPERLLFQFFIQLLEYHIKLLKLPDVNGNIKYIHVFKICLGIMERFFFQFSCRKSSKYL